LSLPGDVSLRISQDLRKSNFFRRQVYYSRLPEP
jgi:hypothetical protein